MIYIVGYRFTVNSVQQKEQRGPVSITEKIALARKAIGQPKVGSMFDPRFVAGNIYEVARIQKVIVDDEPKIKYIFKSITNSDSDIDVVFPSIGDGENYIAAISGKSQELNTIRNSIITAYQDSSDI
jgi:hypothetical protein